MATTNAEGTNADEGVTPKPGDADYVEPPVLKPGDEGYVVPEEDTLVVAIGAEPSLGSEEADDDAPLEDGTPAPQFVKDLRTKAREDARKLRELAAENAALRVAVTPKEPAAIVVGDKPTLEACEYDAEKFAAETLAWDGRKRQAEEAEKKRGEAQKATQDAYTKRLEAYKTGAATLKVTDFDAAEKAVEGVLSNLQQSILIKHAKNAALLVYALGKDAAKLKQLGGITDPVEFGIQAALLEKEIKTVKKSEFKPEGRVGGGGSGALATGATALDKARAKAADTGDFTEVHRLRKEQKAAKKP